MGKKRSATAGRELREQLRAAIRQAAENGRSVNAIAGEAGVPQPVLSRFMTGVRDDLNLQTVEKLLRHFGMRVGKPTKNVKTKR